MLVYSNSRRIAGVACSIMLPLCALLCVGCSSSKMGTFPGRYMLSSSQGTLYLIDTTTGDVWFTSDNIAGWKFDKNPPRSIPPR